MEAWNYWLSELSNKSEATRKKYALFLQKFVDYTQMNANQLIEQRKIELKKEDLREQRAMESRLTGFIASLKDQGYSSSTCKVAYASIRSFFEINYMPLRMRRGSYPQGESLGSRVATRDHIRRILYDVKKSKDYIKLKAIILCLKDSGLRVSDLIALNYGDVAEELEKDTEFISLNRVTIKSKIVAHTFLGYESIEALKEYIEKRRAGTQDIPPETLTKDSPLFRTNSSGKVKRLSRSGISTTVLFHFRRIGEKGLSAHSLRKFLQTTLEASGVNSNWIDQILGHKLLNSRDAYSKPSQEQLKEAYIKAYPKIRIFKSVEIEERISELEHQIEERDILIKGLLNNGTNKNNEIQELKIKVKE
ncbi:MAG: hypothetical protein AC479_02535, partial [miscellaneous Crenarchaeota group-6 archaeon AD8-1]